MNSMHAVGDAGEGAAAGAQPCMGASQGYLV